MLNQCFNIIDFCLIYRSTDYYYFFQFLFRSSSPRCVCIKRTPISECFIRYRRVLEFILDLVILTTICMPAYMLCYFRHLCFVYPVVFFSYMLKVFFPSVKQPQVYHFTTNKKALVGAFFYCTIAYKRDNFLPILSTILSCSATGGRGAEPSLTYPGLAD